MKTQKRELKEYFSGGVQNYKRWLLNDFRENSGYVAWLNSLFFVKSSSIIKYVNGIEGESFIHHKNISLIFPKGVTTVEDINAIDFSSSFFKIEEFDLYSFFSKKEYKSLEQAQKGFPGFYYVFDEAFFENIDSSIISSLKGYQKSNEGVYQKRLADNLIIRLRPNTLYTSHSGVEEYLFPEISIELNGKEFFFFDNSDMKSLLFLPGNSFIFFYTESHLIATEGVVTVTRKHDQPVIYQDEENGNYILTNRYEKLIVYNKYILILLELYRHYIEVFEEWLVDVLV